MTPEFKLELHELIETNRARALWSFPVDFVPQTPESMRRVLQQIAARGDRATWIKAQKLLRQMN